MVACATPAASRWPGRHAGARRTPPGPGEAALAVVAEAARGLFRLRIALAVAGAGAGAGGAARGRPGSGAVAFARPPRQRRPEEAAAGPDPQLVALMERARSGDAEAFGELYDRYVNLVYRYVYYRVGAAALAEDLTSETFLRALRSIGSFRYQGKDFGAWLVTIARNLITDHFKSSRYRLEFSAADLVDTAAELPAPGPEGLVLEAISNEELLEAVKRLGSEQQECIALRFLAGLSVTETAQAMGKNEGAIKALQYRAVRSLARLLPAEQW